MQDLLLADEEVLVVVDVVVLRVLHPHPEGLRPAVHTVVPTEVGRHRQAHAQHRPSYGLQGTNDTMQSWHLLGMDCLITIRRMSYKLSTIKLLEKIGAKLKLHGSHTLRVKY